MNASGREQLQAMAGKNKSLSGLNLASPKGFGVITTLFANMRRYFAGTWFIDGETNLSLRKRAMKWLRHLSEFDDEIIISVMSDFVDTGNTKAPSLNDFVYSCEQLVVKQGRVTRQDRVNARDAAMSRINGMGISVEIKR